MEKKYFCRKCKGIRNHKLLFGKKVRGNEDDYFQWVENFNTIECLGCETISFLKIYSDTEMLHYNEEGEPDYGEEIEIYPKYLENAEELNFIWFLPPKIKSIYSETILALKSKLYILTAGGLRTTIEAICNHLKIKKGDLSSRIDLLHTKGYLSLNESKRLHSIRFLGNDALHDVDIPKKESIIMLLEIVNHLLENLFIQDKKMGDSIARIIDNFEDFTKAIRNNIDKDSINKIYSLNELLGNSRRLVKQKLFVEFEQKLIEEIKNSNIDFLSQNSESNKYEVIKIPDFIFDSN